MKRVLLVNPWIHDFSAYDLWLRPLGLLYVASFLERKGIPFDFLDCLDRFHPLLLRSGMVPKDRGYGTGRFYSEEIDKPAAIAGIPRRFRRFGIPYHLAERYLSSLEAVEVVLVTSSMTYWYGGVREMIDLVRAMFPDARILLGGIYATLMKAHAEAESGADEVISGFDFSPALAEFTGESRQFSMEPFFNETSPAYHVYDQLPHVALITSLGCPFRCSYCASERLAPNYFPLSHERIAGVIEQYAGYGVRDIALYDDALLYNAENHFLPLFEQVAKKQTGIRFHTPNGIHARFITREVARILRLGGFRTVRLGLESSHATFQEGTGKKVTNEEVVAAVANLKGEGFSPAEIGIYLIAGRKDETVNEVLETLSFVEELGVQAFVSEYSPVPGSEDLNREKDSIHSDPLWQNNSIAFLQYGWTRTDMQRIKDVKNRINRSIVSS
jgi:molybdenum cofactor biosynthesis enzyme MoaA